MRNSLPLSLLFPSFPKSDANKMQKQISLFTTSLYFPAVLTAYPLPVRSRHSYIGNAFPTVKTHAQSRVHMPDSSAHFRTSEHICRKPNHVPGSYQKQQRMYPESMASSIIFNKFKVLISKSTIKFLETFIIKLFQTFP